MLPPRKVQFERRISIPQLQVRRALSGGYGGCLCQWELKAPTDRSQSDCVHEQVAKADCECPLYGELAECREGTLEWVDKEKVLSLPTWEGDHLFLERLLSDDPQFFSLKVVYEGEHLAKWTFY